MTRYVIEDPRWRAAIAAERHAELALFAAQEAKRPDIAELRVALAAARAGAETMAATVAAEIRAEEDAAADAAGVVVLRYGGDSNGGTIYVAAGRHRGDKLVWPRETYCKATLWLWRELRGAPFAVRGRGDGNLSAGIPGSGRIEFFGELAVDEAEFRRLTSAFSAANAEFARLDGVKISDAENSARCLAAARATYQPT